MLAEMTPEEIAAEEAKAEAFARKVSGFTAGPCRGFGFGCTCPDCRDRGATEHLGTFAGDSVSIRRDGERIYVTVGAIEDLEYPLDLNGSLQSWVACRIER